MAAQFRFDVTVNVKRDPGGLYIATNDGKLFMMYLASRGQGKLG